MELSDYIAVIRRRWAWVVACLVLGLLAGGIATFVVPREYTATTRIFFSVRGGNNVTDFNQGATYVESQMGSYAQIATAPVVLVPVIEELGLDTNPVKLAHSVNATAPKKTVVLDISVKRENPDEAVAIARGVADQVTRRVNTLAPRDTKGVRVVSGTIISPAALSIKPPSPTPLTLIGGGLLGGLILGLLAALLRDLIARVDTSRHVEGSDEQPAAAKRVEEVN